MSISIFERVETALSGLTVPYAMTRLLLDDGTLPDVFVVYKLIDSTPTAHYDDAEAERDHLVQVNVWKRGGLVGIPDIDALMLPAGFTKGPYRPLPQDAQSGHFGLSLDYHYVEETIA
jgi:hypothetical protein